MAGRSQYIVGDADYVRERKSHNYFPYEINNSKLANTTIQIVCNCGDSVINLQNSFVKICGTATQANGQKLDTLKPVNGFILGLFAEARLILGNHVVESVRHSHLNSLFKSYIFHSRTQLRHSLAGFLFEKTGEKVIDTNGNWEVLIPLDLIFDIAGNRDFIYYTRIEIILQRTVEDCNFFRRVNKTTTGADNLQVEVVSNETGVVTFNKMCAQLEHVTLESGPTSKILNSISNNVLQKFEYNKSSLYIHPNLTSVNKINIPIKTFSFKSLPLYVVIGFTRVKLNDWKYNYGDLFLNNANNAAVYLNGNAFPPTRWDLDESKNQNSQMFAEYVKMFQFYHNDNSNCDVALKKEEFDKNFPIFCIPINGKMFSPLNTAIDLSVELEAGGSGFEMGSTALFFILYKEKFNFSILQNEIINVRE